MMRFGKPFWLVILLASAARAAGPGADRDGAVVAAVQREFVRPYVAWQTERSQFSRAAMPPSETRVRLLSDPRNDAAGAEFVPFAVDARYGDERWIQAQTGCVYVASSAVYVKRGAAFRAAADYFARDAAQPAAPVCADAQAVAP
jgi:hypothetical protein